MRESELTGNETAEEIAKLYIDDKISLALMFILMGKMNKKIKAKQS